ncbi:snurportin-1-like isoform X2 [Oscarella lobularis]|uniref:snurportin-1-like isoform X2 n=1 Tax=Oscarella lobularis TaxID=121494 RepID=UPI003313FA7F
MEEQLEDLLASSLAVSDASSRLSQYKFKGKSNQEKRRRECLERQKRGRMDYTSVARNLAEVEPDQDVEMTTKQKSRGRYYKDHLMLSEWLTEIPDDFYTHWLFIICPVGKRALVISSKGLTAAYTRTGYCLRRFPSALPGGSKRSGFTAQDYCILDCIFHEATRTFYVLDIMCWRGHVVYDSEAEFRLYWAKTKISEVESLSRLRPSNPFRFLCVPYAECTKENLAVQFKEEVPYEVDGVLFYHKEGHYCPEVTPLVTWIQPQGMKETLGVDATDAFLQSRYKALTLEELQVLGEKAIVSEPSAMETT